MSLSDQKSFLSKIHPFEILTTQQMDRCIKHMDIAYYPKNTILMSSHAIADHFFIIIKGSVHEYTSDEELVMDFHPEDAFDANALIYNECKNTFVANEDLICYELEKNTFLDLLKHNEAFGNFFLNNLVHKFKVLKDKEYTSELSSFMIARVEDTFIHKACIVDENTQLLEAIEKSIKYKTSSIIVKSNNNEYGIITDSTLKMKVLLKGRDLSIPVKEIAVYPLLTINNDEYLLEALTQLIKNNIKRMGVVNLKNEMIGVIEQVDILSHFANHTYVVDSQIKKAQSLQDLKNASKGFINIISNLNAKGVKVHHISNLLGQLNTKVYQRLYELIVPNHLQNDACFIVMGSEGRNEQILKTDQDNALVVKDGVDVALYTPYMKKMTQTLIEFGYPPCEGNIMVSNPFWCKNVSQYKTETNKWIEAPDMQNYMDLAIFFDAYSVAGVKSLLIELKEYLFQKLHDKDIFMAYFAKATLTFDTPSKIANFLTTANNIDIKKAGVFPIVQGIRSLALREKIRETRTVNRVKILEQKNILSTELASELLEAFDVLGTVRLKSQIKQLNNGSKINNTVDTHTLSKIERDL
ncbi:MAG: cyclic nucleotide-binding domain-containing protein, partial [Campylobacteraceae bacterium]|nr:cyclic nucleotide-binding domain-containing protein [Campylobacteraceae bacterium]